MPNIMQKGRGLWGAHNPHSLVNLNNPTGGDPAYGTLVALNREAIGIVFSAAYTQITTGIPAVVVGTVHNPQSLTLGTTTRVSATPSGIYTIPITFPVGALTPEEVIAAAIDTTKIQIRASGHTAGYSVTATHSVSLLVLTITVTTFGVIDATHYAAQDGPSSPGQSWLIEVVIL